MSFASQLDAALKQLADATGAVAEAAARLKAECEFAAGLAKAAKKPAWEKLVLKALAQFSAAVAKGRAPKKALAEAEAVLAPLAKAAKRYTVHCVGHAHIDMNWMWNWPETVAITHDTFSTVDRLMDEFPDFKFSQSQISVYQILKDLCPDLYARVKRRIAEGRWEVTASQWVEGDKNMASGEILCRHLLCARRFCKEEFGLDAGDVKIDWECDTFGHAHTLPDILASGGVRWYYFHRTGPGPWLFWWQGRGGARVLAFDDGRRGYNGRINETNVVKHLFDYAAETGLKDFLFVYGVGDHGGGPTRLDITNALELNAWPVFPNVRLSTTTAYFSAVEPKAAELPVVDAEMNTVFEGCFTSQSDIKQANRAGECALVEAEACALVARALAKTPWPAEMLADAWRRAMFNQFHDILPGSNTADSRHYALANFQEILARTTMVKTQALRAVAALIDTSRVCACETVAPEHNVGHNIGQGAGELGRHGMVSRAAAGGQCCEPFVVFNPHPWKRSDVVVATVWDREWPDGEIVVTDDAGSTRRAQVVRKGRGWGSAFIDVALPASDVAGLGWRTFAVARSVEPPKPDGPVIADGKGRMENEFLVVEVDPSTGALAHLVDKRTGLDYVAPNERLGTLEYILEAPHGMTAWVIGQIMKRTPLVEGAMDAPATGPYLATVRVRHKVGASTLTLTVSLAAGSARVAFELQTEWVERGSKDIGVPGLRVEMPFAIDADSASFECPNGWVARPTDPAKVRTETMKYSGWYFGKDNPIEPVPAEVPVQKWAALAGSHSPSGKSAAAVILNDSKYGCRVDHNVFRLSLLRSTYDPDTLPEIGNHTMRWAVEPAGEDWSPADAARAGCEFNTPLNVVSAASHEGTLPVAGGLAEILTPNVLLSGMKKAEDSDALVVRLYDVSGKDTVAKLRLDPSLAAPGAQAVECDVLEAPLAESTAKMTDGTLSVRIRAFGTATVRIG